MIYIFFQNGLVTVLFLTETDKKITVDNMVRDGIVKEFSDLLKPASNSAQNAPVYALIAEILADIAKLGKKLYSFIYVSICNPVIVF